MGGPPQAGGGSRERARPGALDAMPALEFFLRQLANGIILGSAYSLVAIGLTLVFGVLRVINLAQGELFMVGAFAGLFALQAGLGLPVALLAGLAVAGAVGLLVERVALRPLPATVDPHIPMVATIGVGVVLQEVATTLFTARQHPYPTPELLAGRVALGPVELGAVNLFILALAIVLMVAIGLLLRRTKLGLAIRAVAESPRIAGLMGIDRRFVVAVVFALSSALAGLAGVLVGMYFNNLSPYIGVPIGLKGLAAVIFGGLGSVAGAVVAGLVIGVAEVMAVGYIASSWRDAVAFGVMILVLLVRPTGLFGRPALEKV
jgi:branched-chain amino acid transport system permease protein